MAARDSYLPSNIIQGLVSVCDTRDCGDDDSVVECYAEDGEDEGNEDDQEFHLCCWHDIISIIG